MRKATIYFILLSIIGSAINYIAYPTLSRILPAEQYIDITVALSLLTQISTFMSSLIAITIGLSKSHKDSKETVSRLQQIILQAFLVLGALYLLCAPIIMPQIGSPTVYAPPITVMIILSIPITIISGFLNGRQRLVQLGLVSVVTASLQLAAGATCALITRNGPLTMLVMGLTQIISISLLLILFKSEGLPSIRSNIFHFERPEPHLRKIIAYTLISSVAIMIVNLLQVLDLVTIKNIGGAEAQLYTDVYVISRIVFFAGMIFIWPFLGSIKLDEPKYNAKLYMRLALVFALIGVISIAGFAVFGETIYQLMFGRAIMISAILPVVVLSILYKVILLLITALTLYLMVIRSYMCIAVSIISYLSTVVLLQLNPGANNILSILTTLVVGASIALAASLIIILTLNTHNPKSQVNIT